MCDIPPLILKGSRDAAIGGGSGARWHWWTTRACDCTPPIFSERELTFTFALCWRPSICLSSVVCNAPAPYSGGCNFRQHFYDIWYHRHPLTCTENLWRSSQGNTSVGRVKSKRGSKKYSDFGPIEGYISETVKIRGKLVLITNRKSHISFRLVPKSVTLNDLERRNGPYFALFHPFFVYDVVVKRLLGLTQDQNLLLVLYDHINTICAIIQRLFWQNKRRQCPLSTSDCSCLHPYLLMSFL